MDYSVGSIVKHFEIGMLVRQEGSVPGVLVLIVDTEMSPPNSISAGQQRFRSLWKHEHWTQWETVQWLTVGKRIYYYIDRLSIEQMILHTDERIRSGGLKLYEQNRNCNRLDE